MLTNHELLELPEMELAVLRTTPRWWCMVAMDAQGDEVRTVAWHSAVDAC